jgi:RNA recognition motif-containing protein
MPWQATARADFRPMPCVGRLHAPTGREACGDVRCRQVFIGGLGAHVDEAAVRDLFKGAGAVEHVNLLSDQETGQPKGVGFVTMGSAVDAARACETLNGKPLNGRKVRVNMAESKRQ